jgi:hypothetical protein
MESSVGLNIPREFPKDTDAQMHSQFNIEHPNGRLAMMIKEGFRPREDETAISARTTARERE